MNEELKVKFEKALADEVYAKELFALDTPEKIQAKLAEKDIVLTLDEVKVLMAAVLAEVEKRGVTELDEKMLEDVNGGVVLAAIGAGVVAKYVGGAFLIACGVGGFAIGWKLGG